MQKITGIGGIFFKAKDPEALSAWYEKYFGIPRGSAGETWDQQAGPTVFAAFKKDTDYFGNDDQQFMLNFRVADMDALLAELKENGVKIDEKKQEESFGKFAWVYDPEGNKIELWESKD
jgi:glyoxylase I family protein